MDDLDRKDLLQENKQKRPDASHAGFQDLEYFRQRAVALNGNDANSQPMIPNYVQQQPHMQ